VRLQRALGDVTIVGGFDEERRPMGRQWSIPDGSPPLNSSWSQQQLDADLRPGGPRTWQGSHPAVRGWPVRTDRDSGRRVLRLQWQMSRRRRSDCGRVLPGGDCGSGGFLFTTSFAVDSEGLPFTPIDRCRPRDRCATSPAAPACASRVAQTQATSGFRSLEPGSEPCACAPSSSPARAPPGSSRSPGRRRRRPGCPRRAAGPGRAAARAASSG